VATPSDGTAENRGSITCWSRDLYLRLFCLEYPARLPTGAVIYIYVSSVWSTLFDYLMEQRFISMLLPSGVPCSITYWSRVLSLRLFRLEYPVRLPTGAEIYIYASSVWSTLIDYLLEQGFISKPIPSGVPWSITYWSRDLSLLLFRLKCPVRLPTGAEIYLYSSSVWSALFDYLLEQRFMSTHLPSAAHLASGLIEASCKGISFWRREAINLPTYDGEVTNSWSCTSTPICH
jgi:hypothetical protein